MRCLICSADTHPSPRPADAPARSGEALRDLLGHIADVLCHQQSGGRLATGGADRTVRLWDLRSGQREATHVLQLGTFPYCLQVCGRGCAVALCRRNRSLGAAATPCAPAAGVQQPVPSVVPSLSAAAPTAGRLAAGGGLRQRHGSGGGLAAGRRHQRQAGFAHAAASTPRAGEQGVVGRGRGWAPQASRPGGPGGAVVRVSGTRHSRAPSLSLVLVPAMLCAQVWALALSDSRLVSASLDAEIVVRSFHPAHIADVKAGRLSGFCSAVAHGGTSSASTQVLEVDSAYGGSGSEEEEDEEASTDDDEEEEASSDEEEEEEASTDEEDDEEASSDEEEDEDEESSDEEEEAEVA